VHNSRWPLYRLFVFFDHVNLTFRPNTGERGIVTDYPCAKSGDFSFNRFGFIVQTDGITDAAKNLYRA